MLLGMLLGMLLWREGFFSWGRHVLVLIIIVISAAFASEVCRALVLVWLSILGNISHVRAIITLKFPHILISADGLIDISRGELVQLLVVAENNDGDIDGAED